MLLRIPDVLTPEQVAHCRATLSRTAWVDGNVTSGHLAARAKDNDQVPEDAPAARELGEIILSALARSPLFLSAALPLKTYPPLFNRYRTGQGFQHHVDNAVRTIKGTPHRVRTDLSATLFLTSPEEYDGGELTVEDTYGAHRVKLPAGHLVLYPSSSLHLVTPVTRGERIASFFWIQSMVRDDGERTLLFDLDQSIQRLARDHADHPSIVSFTASYHNLLRRWADA